jgi:hypothetical protein
VETNYEPDLHNNYLNLIRMDCQIYGGSSAHPKGNASSGFVNPD